MTRKDFEEVLKKQFKYKTMPDYINICDTSGCETEISCYWFNHPTLFNIDFLAIKKRGSINFSQKF